MATVRKPHEEAMKQVKAVISCWYRQHQNSLLSNSLEELIASFLLTHVYTRLLIDRFQQENTTFMQNIQFFFECYASKDARRCIRYFSQSLPSYLNKVEFADDGRHYDDGYPAPNPSRIWH